MGCDKNKCSCKPQAPVRTMSKVCCGREMKLVGTTTYPYQFLQCEVCGSKSTASLRG